MQEQRRGRWWQRKVEFQVGASPDVQGSDPAREEWQDCWAVACSQGGARAEVRAEEQVLPAGHGGHSGSSWFPGVWGLVPWG